MTTPDYIQLCFLVIAAAGFWLQQRGQEANRRKDAEQLRKSLSDNMHSIDKRMHGIEIIVGPYASQMKNLEDRQAENMAKIANIEARLGDLDRLGRELEAIRNRR